MSSLTKGLKCMKIMFYIINCWKPFVSTNLQLDLVADLANNVHGYHCRDHLYARDVSVGCNCRMASLNLMVQHEPRSLGGDL